MEPNPQHTWAASVERIRGELDNWLEVAVTRGGEALDKMGIKPDTGVWLPAFDMCESSKQVCVWVDLPGVEISSVSVELTGNMLTISGKRDETRFCENSVVHSSERRTGQFQRPIPMPAAVDADSVIAEANNGVLKVTLSKAVEAQPRQIPITTGSKPETSEQPESP